MEHSIERKAKITFTLNEKEAAWLKGFIQNPNCHPDDEPADEREIRYNIFNALIEMEDS